MTNTQSEPDQLDAACEVMHDAYEHAATGAGWETNPASRKPWTDVPPANQTTMRAAVSALLDWLDLDQLRTERDYLRQDNAELRDACAALQAELDRTRQDHTP